MKTLHLTLQKKWFDQIKAGTKTEEYREIKPHWNSRLLNKNYDIIKFVNGYNPTSPTMLVEFLGYKIKTMDGQKVYAIQLGKILKAD